MKSKPKIALSIVRVIHPGSRVTTDYSRMTNNHTTSAPDYFRITNNHTTSAPTVRPKDPRFRGPEGARGERNTLSQAKTAQAKPGRVCCVAR